MSKKVSACRTTDERIEALEKQYPPLTTIEARIAALENSVASIKLYAPPPEMESVRCNCNQTAFVGHAEKAQTKSYADKNAQCKAAAYAHDPCPKCGHPQDFVEGVRDGIIFMWHHCANCAGAPAEALIREQTDSIKKFDTVLGDILDVCRGIRKRVDDSEDVVTDWCSKIAVEAHNNVQQIRKIVAEELLKVPKVAWPPDYFPSPIHPTTCYSTTHAVGVDVSGGEEAKQ